MGKWKGDMNRTMNILSLVRHVQHRPNDIEDGQLAR